MRDPGLYQNISPPPPRIPPPPPLRRLSDRCTISLTEGDPDRDATPQPAPFASLVPPLLYLEESRNQPRRNPLCLWFCCVPHPSFRGTVRMAFPEEYRLHMRAFTRPSKQLRNKVRPALLRSLLHTSLYRRLLLRAITNGARTAQVGKGIHSRINHKPRDGIALLKFLHGQYYTGKLAYRYGHAPSDACPLCVLPDSCTHVAGECPAHASQIISKHNAACLLTHATVRKAFKGGGALFSPHTIHLVTADAGNKSQTPGAMLDSLEMPSSPLPSAPSESPDLTLSMTPHFPNPLGGTRDTSTSRQTSGNSSGKRRPGNARNALQPRATSPSGSYRQLNSRP